MWAELPEDLPNMLQDPAAVAHGARTAAPDRPNRPEAPEPAESGDGEMERLGSISVTHRFVDAPGDSATRRWHLVECGPSDAEPVIFLHGVPDSWYQWHHAIEALGPATAA